MGSVFAPGEGVSASKSWPATSSPRPKITPFSLTLGAPVAFSEAELFEASQAKYLSFSIRLRSCSSVRGSL